MGPADPLHRGKDLQQDLSSVERAQSKAFHWLLFDDFDTSDCLRLFQLKVAQIFPVSSLYPRTTDVPGCPS